MTSLAALTVFLVSLMWILLKNKTMHVNDREIYEICIIRMLQIEQRVFYISHDLPLHTVGVFF